MKKLSIKLRVTLWFTLFMTLLVGIVLVVLFSVGERIVTNVGKETLISVLTDSAEEIEIDDGRIEIDDDLDFFQKGVYLSVYDSNGNLLYGRLPRGFKNAPPFQDKRLANGLFGNETRYVYDVELRFERYGTVWLRGVLSATENDNTFQTLTNLAAITLPFLVILAAIGGYILIHRAFRPVRRINEAAERINGSRDLSQRINLGAGNDEIYTLANTFDRMFDRLETAFEREKQFTSDASHELRTPVAVIISQCEYSLKNDGNAKPALETILTQARRMSALIGQLLTLTRADQGQVKLQTEMLNLSELAEVVADQVRESAERKNITVETEIDPDILFRGDETLLMRMLLNLLENGIKFSREGGKLTLNLSRSGKTVIGTVRDNGIGIPAESLKKIWERFYQANPARSGAENGVGLGLPMVRYIAEAHGGSVEAESNPGNGSVFRFILPISK